MIEKNKELRAKYKGKKVDLEKDSSRSAKPFGYRFKGKHDYRVPTKAQVKEGLKRGTIDHETRANRSDVHPEAKVKLAKGGGVGREYDQWAKNIYDNQSEQQAREGLIQFARENGFEYSDVEKALQVYKYDTEENAFGEQYTKKAIRGMISMIAKGGGGKLEYAKGGTAPVKEKKKRGGTWVWKESALTDKIVKKKKFKNAPSKFMRKKYPQYVENIK